MSPVQPPPRNRNRNRNRKLWLVLLACVSIALLLLSAAALVAETDVAYGVPGGGNRRRTQLFSRPPKRVGIIGAGPAGLSMAKTLKILDTGVEDVEVFDRYDSCRPSLGAGVQLNGGAVILSRLGLGEELKKAGNPVRNIVSRTVANTKLLQIDLKKAAKDTPELIDQGTPMFFTIMRDSLQNILATSLDPECISTNKRLVSLVEENDKVICAFEDGSRHTFDMVIGADGIRSEVKRQVWGEADTAPVYSNIRIQFGVAEGWNRGEDTTGDLHQWFGDGVYTLTGQYLGMNGNKFEMIALVYADTHKNGENPSWQETKSKEDTLTRLKLTKNPKEVVELAERCERFFEVGVYYYPSFRPWTSPSGRVVLIGDAAHAMPPFLGQGANQAIQDSYCLGKKLEDLNSGKLSDVKSACVAYESSRKLPTTALQLESRFLGFLETAGGGPGTLPPIFRDAFFFMTGKLGIAEKVFIAGATPKV